MSLSVPRLLLSILFVLGFLSHAAKAVKVNEDEPVLYYADSQTYDRELGILILKGNVEFKHEGTTLEADYVTYNEKANLVTASGNVRMREPDGNVYFAEYLELTGDLKEGVALELRGLLDDDTKVAAIEGRKFEDRQEYEQAVYTPCELCGDRSPTWQFNAKKVVKDEKGQNISFTDTQLRILDVPVLYAPYLTQPLVRKSGFLIPQPRYTTDTDLGFIADLPYYIVISQDKDLTLSPAYITGQQSPFLSGAYRQAFNTGMMKIEGSITNYKRSPADLSAQKAGQYSLPACRGHIFGTAATDLTDTWRMRGEGGYVSDKTYFRKYVFAQWQSLPALTSKGILEGFLNQRDYAAASVQYYQGLQNTDIQNRIPAPLPYLEYSAYSDVDPLGGRFTFDGNLLNIVRAEDVKMQRGIGIVGWQRPWLIPSGQVFTLFGSLRGDLYGVQGNSIFTTRRKGGGGRFFPQAGLNWKWPFIAEIFQKQNLVLQPVAQLIGAPVKAVGLEATRVPNIDSLDLIYNDVDLYSPDRYPGYDVIDTGSRATYGLETIATGTVFGDMEFFFGQNYAFDTQTNTLTTLQGMGKGFSDYVGRFQGTPYKWINFIYRFRLEEQTFAPLISEVQAAIGPPIANFSGTYVFLHKNTRLQERTKNFNQMNLVLSSQFAKFWTLRGTLLQDFQRIRDGGGSLVRSLGIMYRDDCFSFGVTVQRQYFVAHDLKPETLYMFTIGFKNVGDFPILSFDMDKGLFGGKYNRALE